MTHLLGLDTLHKHAVKKRKNAARKRGLFMS